MTYPLTDGRTAVAANRWDLVADRPARAARVAVVIPYFEQQRQLDLTLAALALQDHPRDLLEVVVADDGSAHPPRVSDRGVGMPVTMPVTVVRQPDRGFRAAAARNLGVAQSRAEVLCFLDADTVPEPSYVRRISRLAAQVPDALVVGRRRHADLSSWTPQMLPGWWAGARRPPELTEPAWLRDAYAGTEDLLHVDHRTYRYVISSVMCCSRALFDDVGGFDETFVGYGGEDWEFAHRAAVGGAVFHHARTAVAWHDGPDWGERDVAERAAQKNREAVAVARLVCDPDARRHGLRYEVPETAVTLDTTGHGLGSLVHALAGVLSADVGVWLRGPEAGALLALLGAADPRIRVGEVPDDVRRRCRTTVTLTGRVVLPPAGFAALLARCAAPATASVTVSGPPGTTVVVRSSWAVNRARRWGTGEVRLVDGADAEAFGSHVEVAADDVGLTVVPADAGLSW